MNNKSLFGVGVLGTGKYIPNQLLSNEQIEASTGLESGTIIEKTGIEKRYVAGENETASSMASIAAKKAIIATGINPEEINLIICSTFTGDYRYPALACKIQKDIGAKNAGSFDIMANCTGFQVGLSVASEKMLINPEIKYTLVVGVALQSRFINWKDSNSSIYFGDGAGAAVLGHVPVGYGLLSTDIFSNTNAYEAVRLRGSGSSFPMSEKNGDSKLDYYEINGLEVWKQLIKYQPTSIKNSLKKINYDIGDVDLFLFHQANLRLIEYLMAKMRISLKKTFTNVEKYGNTADASLAIVLSDAFEKKRIKRNDTVVISGVGAGFIFGSSVFRWY
jgi:3-oxoacyl-[acyl-carrier-protein] synthase III